MSLSRWRVPLSWLCGLGALFLASPTPPLYAAGLLVAAAGEAIRLWAAGHLEKNQRLAMGGPYAWTRNPLYFGSLWVGFGFALATGRLVFIAVVLALFVLVYGPVMKREAARLAEAFPAAYARYAASTPLFWPSPPKKRTRAADLGRFTTARVFANREHHTMLGWMVAALVLGWKLL